QYVSDEWIDAKEELETGQTDYVLFTSASTVHGFAAVTQGLDYTKVKAVCIGRQTEEAAASLGMRTWRAKQASTDSLVERLVEVYAENRQE
ncbi:MAG: uroporphyrinogen-III synthase, partial [Lachnospiraceae bacterium]